MVRVSPVVGLYRTALAPGGFLLSSPPGAFLTGAIMRNDFDCAEARRAAFTVILCGVAGLFFYCVACGMGW